MRPACFGSVALLKKLGESLYAVHVFDVVIRSLFDETYSGHGGANVRTEDMLAASWGAESADFAGVEAKQWLVVCFCKLASTVWALFFSSIGGWLPAETAPSEPAAPFSLVIWS